MIQLTAADYQAIGLSLKIAVTSVLVSLPFGFGAAYVATFTKFRGKILLETMINLPLTLPPVVIGYLLLLFLGRKGWLGQILESFGIRLIFTWQAAVIACMVVGFPLMVRSIRISMESIDIGIIRTSRSLGAHWHDTIASVILPLSRRGIIAGSALMFARSLGEFGATVIVAGNIPGVTQTIPMAIYDYTSSPGGEPMAAALCLVAIAISAAVLLLHGRLTAPGEKGGKHGA